MISKGFRFGMLLQIAIGPLCLYIFQTAVSCGFITALAGVLGVVIGDSLYILAAIFGIGSILNKYEKAKIIMKYFGAIIIILFGINIILGALGISIIPSINVTAGENMKSIFISTFILTLSSPLTILFWAGIFSTKIIDENINQADMYLFGFGAVLSTLFFLTIISILGSFINSFLSEVMLNGLNVIVGVVVIFFGIKACFKRI